MEIQCKGGHKTGFDELATALNLTIERSGFFSNYTSANYRWATNYKLQPLADLSALPDANTSLEVLIFTDLFKRTIMVSKCSRDILQQGRLIIFSALVAKITTFSFILKIFIYD